MATQVMIDVRLMLVLLRGHLTHALILLRIPASISARELTFPLCAVFSDILQLLLAVSTVQLGILFQPFSPLLGGDHFPLTGAHRLPVFRLARWASLTHAKTKHLPVEGRPLRLSVSLGLPVLYPLSVGWPLTDNPRFEPSAICCSQHTYCKIKQAVSIHHFLGF